jgi:hypothetical protein
MLRGLKPVAHPDLSLLLYVLFVSVVSNPGRGLRRASRRRLPVMVGAGVDSGARAAGVWI